MQKYLAVRWGLVAAILGFAALPAQAMSTEQAVKTLLGSSAKAIAWPPTQQGTGRIAPAAPTMGVSDGGRVSMVVPGGATLARLLAPVVGKIQLPKAQVYKAFVSLNPQAFVRGNPNRIMAGATVYMFSDADIAKLNGRAAPASAEARRGWVRFP